MAKELALVYMVAGMSSRFGGKIKQFAKIGLNNETLIEYSINQALPAGFTKIVFIVGNKTEKPFLEMFGNTFKGIPVYYALQNYDSSKRDCPWGTTDALCSAKNLINCPFIVCNGDDIYGKNSFKQLAEHLEKNNSTSATIGYFLKDLLPEKGKVNRGIFEIQDNYVKNICETFNIEKTTLGSFGLKPTNLCNANIFAFYPSIFKLLEPLLISFKNKYSQDKRAECFLPEEISKLIKAKKLKMKFYLSTELWVGVTNPEDEEVVRKKLKTLESGLSK